jgi:predicted MFS family arabinose efflux permease
MNPGSRSTRALTIAIAVAVAVAFADSSIVVLALPELYAELGTSVSAIAWVITSYNVVVVVAAFAALAVIRRVDMARLMQVGLVIFLGASIACAAANGFDALIAARCVQGLGGALVLVGALPLLAGLAESSPRAAAVWALAGTLGAALGPALGGLLTELFSWRAIFIAQAPLVGVALLATVGPHVKRIPAEPVVPVRPSGAANLALALVFGALVGALFLAVLMLVAVWGLSPLHAAGIVSVLPVAALAARPLAASLRPRIAAAAGAAILAAGLVGLALLPDTSEALAALALALCGLGLGLAVPVLSHATISPESGLAGSGAWSIGSRHAGLVLALALIGPLLAYELDQSSDTAALMGAAVALDAPIKLTTKVPIALDLRDALEQSQQGEVPDLEQVFADHGADDNESVADTRDRLLGAIQAVLTRAFRSSYAFAALLAALAIIPTFLVRRLELW